MERNLLLPAALLLAACSAPVAGTPPSSPAVHAGDASAPTSPGEMAPPASLPEGDRWFVALRSGSGAEPIAERTRRTRGDGFVREEVTWGRSFASVATAEHGMAQVFALVQGPGGITASLVDHSGRPFGDSRVEVGAPYRAGTAWIVRTPEGDTEGRIIGIEAADTPGGPVEALRVELRSPGSRPTVATTWLDRDLRPVRMEVRRGPSEVLESRAALASPSPTVEECRAALEWAKRNLPVPAK